MTIRITVVPYFVHHPVFEKLENTTFRKPDLFPSSGEGRKTPTLLGPKERAKLIQCYQSLNWRLQFIGHRDH
jgi:hypothetical protein